MTTQEVYCLEYLRNRAYAIYYALLFAPKNKRGALAAIYSFQLEILHIAKSIKEPMLAEIRLQWWRDQINHCVVDSSTNKEVPNSLEKKSIHVSKSESINAHNSPIISALIRASVNYGVNISELLNVCNAVQTILYSDNFKIWSQFEKYNDDIFSIPLKLSCQVLSENDSKIYNKIFYFGGQAWGIVELMRLLTSAFSHNHIYFPEDILVSMGIKSEELKNIILASRSCRKNDEEYYKYNLSLNKIKSFLVAQFNENYKNFKRELIHVQCDMYLVFLPLSVLPALVKSFDNNITIPDSKNSAFLRIRQQFQINKSAITKKF